MNENHRLCVKFMHCGNLSLANPEDQEQKNIFFMPMGLIPMANELKRNGFDAEILHTDFEAGHPIEEVLDFDTIDLVGFDDHWVNESVVVLETAELIKRIKPDIFIVLGGFTASLFTEEIISHFPQVDAIVRGDGEVPIVELCRVLQEEKEKSNPKMYPDTLKSVQNLVWRDENQEFHINEFSYVARAQDMEKLDFAEIPLLRNWEMYLLNSTFYSHFEPICIDPMFLLEVARGCEYACTYCGGNCVAQKRMNNRSQTVFRSVESSIETMKKAISFGFKTFYTSIESRDSDDWFIELFKRVEQENLHINYAYGTWRVPPKALIDVMSDACRQAVIEISPESGMDDIRAKNKDRRLAYTNAQLEECLDHIASKKNIKAQIFFAFYLAFDTEETIMNTISYILSLLIKYGELLEIEYTNFSTDPGSLFFFYPEKYQIDINVRNFRDYVKHLRENYVEKKGQQADMTVFKPSYMSEAENVEMRRRLRLLSYLFVNFRKSLSYLLYQTREPEIILSLLKESDVSLNEENTFPPETVKNLLLSAAFEAHILDETLIQLLYYDYQQIFEEYRVSKPTDQLYFDFEIPQNISNEEADALFHYLTSPPNIDEEMNIAFDFVEAARINLAAWINDNR